MVDVAKQHDERLNVTIAPPPLSNGSNASSSASPPASTPSSSSGKGLMNGSSAPAAAAASTSAPATPLVAARSVPSMSPSASAMKLGRGLRQKMIDELKSVRRKSPPPEKGTPALTPILEPSALSGMGASSAGMIPPPLMLNAPANDDGNRSSQGEDGGRLSSGQLSPADLSGVVPGKGKGCSICERSFTVFRAKHTCKVCGNRICDDCSKNRVKLNRRLERKKGSRLCDPCARKYVQASMPLMSPSASPMLAPAMMQRRHSVPSGAFSRTPSGSVISNAGVKASEQQQVNGTQEGSGGNGADTVASSGNNSVKSAFAAVEKREPHDSHLRTRHWASLAVISALVFLRILIGGPTRSSSAVVRGLDSVLSIKILGCYILGLVVFDEILRSKNKSSNVVSSPAAGVVYRRRRRTKSRAVSTAQVDVSPTCGDQEQDEEVLEVDTGDKVAETGSFSFEKLIAALEETAVKERAANNELKLSAFLACCESICGFVLVFGRATSFAGSTVNGYVVSINANLATWPPSTTTSEPWREQSIRAIIEREVELQIANVGGKKKPSCSRCLLRLLWFVEFVEACVKYTLIESTDENCSSGASKAYEETIGSRHPWIIRKGVNSALSSIPARSTVLADLNLSSCSPEDAIARLKVGQSYMKAIIAEIHQALKKHDLLDIK